MPEGGYIFWLYCGILSANLGSPYTGEPRSALSSPWCSSIPRCKQQARVISPSVCLLKSFMQASTFAPSPLAARASAIRSRTCGRQRLAFLAVSATGGARKPNPSEGGEGAPAPRTKFAKVRTAVKPAGGGLPSSVTVQCQGTAPRHLPQGEGYALRSLRCSSISLRCSSILARRAQIFIAGIFEHGAGASCPQGRQRGFPPG